MTVDGEVLQAGTVKVPLMRRSCPVLRHSVPRSSGARPSRPRLVEARSSCPCLLRAAPSPRSTCRASNQICAYRPGW
jgi:hypothetical protein